MKGQPLIIAGVTALGLGAVYYYFTYSLKLVSVNYEKREFIFYARGGFKKAGGKGKQTVLAPNNGSLYADKEDLGSGYSIEVSVTDKTGMVTMFKNDGKGIEGLRVVNAINIDFVGKKAALVETGFNWNQTSFKVGKSSKSTQTILTTA